MPVYRAGDLGSIPGGTSTQDLNIIEEKVLPLLKHLQMVRLSIYCLPQITKKTECTRALKGVIVDFQLLTLSVPVSYQQPTSPYITHTKYDIW